MIQPISRSARRRPEGGFTLIELLVVIVILAVLAAVVVFAVGGVTDKGEASAARTDARTIATAQELYLQGNGRYGTMGELVAAGFLAAPSSIHDVVLVPGGPSGGPASAYVLTAAAPTDRTLTIGVNPQNASADFSGANGPKSNFGMFPTNTNMFETLVRLTPDFQVEPWLAESWERLPNNNPSYPGASATFRFHLRPGVRFHDGRELKADSVVYTVNTRIAPNGSLRIGNQSAAPVPGDEWAVDITPTATNERLVDQLTHPSVGAIVAAGTVPFDGTTPTPVGTGPFRFESYTRGQALVVARNDDYWEAPARLRTLTFRFGTDPNTRVLALRGGEIDLAYDVPKDSLAAVDAAPGLKTALLPPGANEVMFLNKDRGPAGDVDYLADVRVRRAVRMAIDRDAVISATYPGGARRADTMIPAALLGSHASIVTGAPYDPGAAAALLDEAGWTCGGGAPGAGTACAAGEMRQKGGAGPLALKLVNGYTPIEIRLPADLLVKDALEAVGAQVTLTRVGSQGEYDAALSGGTHDLYMERIAQNDANPASAPSSFFDSTASALAQYPPRFGPGAAFEALMAQARAATDREVAKQRTAEALHEALDVQAMAVHLASVNWLLGMKDDVTGLVPMGTLRAIRWAPVSRIG